MFIPITHMATLGASVFCTPVSLFEVVSRLSCKGTVLGVALQITSPIDSSNLPNPRTAGQQAPGTDLGISKATDAIPDLGKAAKSLDSATPSLPNPSEAAKGLPNPAEAAKGLDNPFDSVKSLFGQ